MYIKCNVSEEVIQEICDTITKNTDYWSVEMIGIALKIFAWRDTEVGYEYLKNNRNNSNKIVAHYANHWYNFLQDNEEANEFLANYYYDNCDYENAIKCIDNMGRIESELNY